MIEKGKVEGFTTYLIKGEFIELSADAIELAVKKVNNMLVRLNDNYQIEVDDSIKVTAKDLNIEVKEDRINLRSKNIEVEIRSKDKKYFCLQGGEKKVLSENEKKTAMNMIYLIIISELDYLLPLVPTIKLLAGVE